MVEFLNYLMQAKGCTPERLQIDKCSEFIRKELDRWAYDNNVVFDFSRASTLTDNS